MTEAAPGSAIFLDFFMSESGQQMVRTVYKSDPQSSQVLLSDDALPLEEFQTFIKQTLAEWSEGHARNTNVEDWCYEAYESGQEYSGAFVWEDMFYSNYGLEKATLFQKFLQLTLVSKIACCLILVSIGVAACRCL